MSLTLSLTWWRSLTLILTLKWQATILLISGRRHQQFFYENANFLCKHTVATFLTGWCPEGWCLWSAMWENWVGDCCQLFYRLWCWTLCQTFMGMWTKASWLESWEEAWSTATVSGYTTVQWVWVLPTSTWYSMLVDSQGCSPQAIENFAVTVKTTAQLLQKFGTDLAETELPNDIQCTKDLLVTHTVKHNNLKVIHLCLHHITSSKHVWMLWMCGRSWSPLAWSKLAEISWVHFLVKLE